MAKINMDNWTDREVADYHLMVKLVYTCYDEEGSRHLRNEFETITVETVLVTGNGYDMQRVDTEGYGCFYSLVGGDQ
jgi:hypothetical protein